MKGAKPMTKKKKKVIQDKFITDELFNRLLFKTAEQLQDKQFKQIDIYNVLQKYNLSNKTVARIINELIPTAHATQGSVTSLVWNYNKNNLKNKYSKEFISLLLNLLEVDESKRFDFIELSSYIKENYPD